MPTRVEAAVVSGRVPPHNLDAEAAVLSAVLLHREALDGVLEILRPEHFYSEANARIFEGCCDLSTSGTPVDIVSLANWLRDRGRLAQVGGAPYLAQLADATPSVGNVAAHALIVHEKWRIRQFIAICQRFAAEGYGDISSAQEFIDRGEQAIYDLARTARSNAAQPLATIIKDVFEKLEAAAERGERITGISTGFEKMDAKTAGLHDGDLTIVAARPGMGKAQPLDAKILTPTGWRQMGALRVGDVVIGADGTPHQIAGVFDRGELDVYRVTTSDGASTECCDEHLWLTRSRSERRRGLPGRVRELREIRATLHRDAAGGLNHSIQFMRPAEFEPLGHLPIAPYLLGVYLGDGYGARGNIGIDNPEADIRERIKALALPGDVVSEDANGLHLRFRRKVRANAPSDMKVALEALGLGGLCSWQKFIPEMYLRASVEDRIALLQGLCDTDGYVVQPKIVEYTTTSPALLAGLEFLVGSLGGRFTWTEKDAYYTKAGGERVWTRRAYRALISFPDGQITPVSSEKHMARWAGGRGRIAERFIRRIEYVGRKVCRCIAVDGEDHLYVTDGFLVTHNTSYVLNLAVNVASPRAEPNSEVATYGYGVFIASLEMPRDQLAKRMACCEGRVDLGRMRNGFLLPEDWRRLTEASSFLSSLPIVIDDTPAITLLELRAKVRRMQAEYDRPAAPGRPARRVGLVVIDYLQLMKGRDGVTSREQEISELSRGLKQLAKELKVAVIALSQLNRAVETRSTKDKRPQLSDLRESGAIEQDADNIVFLYRPSYYDENCEHKWLCEAIIAKQRNGPTGKVALRFESFCTRFDNLAHGDVPQDFDDE